MVLLNGRGGLLRRRNNIVIPPDPNFNNVVFLSHFDGADNSTSFIDVKGKTITRNGLAVISSTQSKFGGSSLYLPNIADYLSVSGASGDFAFGTGAFTLEAWVYPTVSGSGLVMSNPDWMLRVSSGTLSFGISGFNFLSTSSAITLNTWSYIAITRSGNTFRSWANGTNLATANQSVNWTNTGEFRVGRNNNSTEYYQGYIEEVRVTKGIARDCSVVPTTAFSDN